MARGMVVGEAIQSQAQTKAFDENWDRMEHHDDGKRGRFVWDPVQQKLVRPYEREESHALHAPIMVDRFMEGAHTVEGVDIGSRRKREEYMRRTGTAPADDFSPQYLQRVRSEADAADTRRVEAAVTEQFERAALMRETDYRKHTAEERRRRMERDRRAGRDVDD